MKTSLFLGTALSAMLVTGIAAADVKNFHSEPDSTHELPQGASTAAFTAVGDFTLDTTANTLCGKVTLSPTTTTLTGMHIHQGDDTTSGAILLYLPDAVNSTTAGEIDINFKNLPADLVSAISDTPTYLNLHTDAFPNGAVRDQLATSEDATPCVGTAIDYQAGDAGTLPADSGTTNSSSSSSGATTAEPDAGTAAPAGDTSDSGGCSTSGSGSTGDALAILAGLGLVVAAASRKRNKKKA